MVVAHPADPAMVAYHVVIQPACGKLLTVPCMQIPSAVRALNAKSRPCILARSERENQDPKS